MGLLKAGLSAIGGTLTDQWLDYFTVPADISQTAAIFPAISRGANARRGSNTKSSSAMISNGSQIIIPEGYGLLTFQDGRLTSLATEPGAYIWDTESLDAQSIFVDGNMFEQLIGQSWERFKYGGRTTSQQLALFVNLKELPNNKFGTQNTIYWDDAYLNAQVGATTRGTYALKIVDPVLFVSNFLPASFLQNGHVFDFLDPENQLANQLFNEVVGSLAPAFSIYTNDPKKDKRISSIQSDSIGFSQSLAKAVDDGFQWTNGRGLSIVRVAIMGIDYDEQTRALLSTVQRADALAGARGNVNLQAAVAAGFEAAGAVDGAAGLVGLGMATSSIGVEGLQQQLETRIQPNSTESTEVSVSNTSKPSTDSLVSQLEQLKKALDLGLISQTDYNEAKNNVLGI